MNRPRSACASASAQHACGANPRKASGAQQHRPAIACWAGFRADWPTSETLVVMSAAGKCQQFMQEGIEPTFAIITTSANELVAEIYDRMPLILAPGDYARWLGEEPETDNPMRAARYGARYIRPGNLIRRPETAQNFSILRDWGNAGQP